MRPDALPTRAPEMIRLALFLLPYAPRRLRPWLMGIAIGRKPEQMEWRDGKWRLPLSPEEERDQREFLDSFNRQVAELEAKDRASDS